MKIYFLGTNGWFDSETGNTTCILIDSREAFVILDAGGGIYKVDKFIKNSSKPVCLFISHFHLDHIYGLHTLEKFNFRQGLDIYSQPNSKKILDTIINKPFSMPFSKLKFPVSLHEIGEGVYNKPFKFEARFLLHASACLGFRMRLEGKVITFCTDTGYCKNLLSLAKGADLLITECSYASGQINHGWPHLNPEQAAAVAQESKVKKLALMHFDAGVYDKMQKRNAALKKASGIFRNTIAAKDGMRISL